MESNEFRLLKEQLDRIEATQLQILEQLSLRGQRLARLGLPAPNEPHSAHFVLVNERVKHKTLEPSDPIQTSGLARAFGSSV